MTFKNSLGRLARSLVVAAVLQPTPAIAKDKDRINRDSLFEQVVLVESGGNPRAISSKRARGLGQIMPQVVIEYNREHPSEKKHGLLDLYNPDVNAKITSWYLNRIIDHYLPAYGLAKSIENIAGMYNFGPTNLGILGDAVENFAKLPTETQNYIRRIKKGYSPR
jgi:soluble lytic murein transglycosylase-like protein